MNASAAAPERSAESGRPVPKPPVLPSDRLSVRRIGELGGTRPTVYVFRDVLDELVFTARYRPLECTAGILTGGHYVGPAGPYVEVRGFCDSAVVESSHEFSQQLRQTFRSLQERADLAELGLLPLGWFVSRPGSQGRPGPFELITHCTWFNRPYHVCLVLDSEEERLGMYRQVEGCRLVNVGFNLIEPVTPPPPPETNESDR